jgi:hypothetical protein
MKKLACLSVGLFLVTIFLTLAKGASAEVSQFPSCPNFSGTIQAQYSNGFHAIVGDPNNQEGADTVYDLQNGNFMQCFCPTKGDSGIQTNWLKVSEMSDQRKQDLISRGWVLIEQGSDWGLEKNPYLTQNSNFSCGGNSRNTGGTGGPTGGSPSSVCTDTSPQKPYVTGVKKLSDTSVLLTWSPNPGTNNYSIVYGTSPNSYQYGVPSTGNVTSYTISSLDSKATYYFAIRAANGCAPSGLSNEISAGATSNSPHGEVLGASTLPPTGSLVSQMQLFGTLALAFLSLGYGIALKRRG